MKTFQPIVALSLWTLVGCGGSVRREIEHPAKAISPEASRIVRPQDSTNYKVESYDEKSLCFWVGVLMPSDEAKKLSFELTTSSDPEANYSGWSSFKAKEVSFLQEYEAGYYTPKTETYVEQSATGELTKREQFVAKKKPVSELRVCFEAKAIKPETRAMTLTPGRAEGASVEPGTWVFPALARQAR